MPDYKFWNERWLSNLIGFHQARVHAMLGAHIDLFKGHKKVLVPLCGKSLDMLYLREQGLEVVGVEFSELAILDFIKENHLQLERKASKNFIIYEGERLKIFQGDFFLIDSKDLEGITSCYDRAAMVAFNAIERERYASQLIHVAKDLKMILAPLLDYGDIAESNPPFSVSAKELAKLYGSDFDLKVLNTQNFPIREALKVRGANYEKEVTWLFKRKEEVQS
jgi:thiopurine S-methyltransferase